MSDWFVTYGGYSRDGNDIYDENVGEIHSILSSYAPYGEVIFRVNPYPDLPPTYGKQSEWMFQPMNDEHGRKFRDVLLPYTIRAVAGMLYKYIIETKMQDRYATANEKGSIADQQQELNLFNQYINGNYYSFRAWGNPGRITVCPETRPAGYPADFTIGSCARNVTFNSNNEINYKPGFSALKGSEVHAYISTGECEQCLDEDFNPQYIDNCPTQN